MKDEGIAQRLQAIRTELGHNKAEMGRVLGCGSVQWSKYEHGENVPGGLLLKSIGELGINVDWLLTGRGGMLDGGQTTHGDLLPSSFVLIPRYDVEASAGRGALNDSEFVVDQMAFQEKWVRDALGVNPSNLVLITAVGDSMEPAIRAGDLLLVDIGVDRIVDDAIYVLVRRDELVVKRVQQFFNGGVTIKSDAPAYMDESLGADEVDEIRIAGRVRWIGRLI